MRVETARGSATTARAGIYSVDETVTTVTASEVP
jgi:hypothetical protein